MYTLNVCIQNRSVRNYPNFPDTNVLYFARQKGQFVRERLALWLYWIYNKYSTLITVHQYTWLIFILNLVCGFFYATTIYIFVIALHNVSIMATAAKKRAERSSSKVLEALWSNDPTEYRFLLASFSLRRLGNDRPPPRSHLFTNNFRYQQLSY